MDEKANHDLSDGVVNPVPLSRLRFPFDSLIYVYIYTSFAILLMPIIMNPCRTEIMAVEYLQSKQLIFNLWLQKI
jgi:hypothetical protein